MNTFLSQPLWVMAAGITGFGLLYGVMAGGGWLLTRHVLPRLQIGRLIDASPLPQGQLTREIGLSCASVLLFGAGLVVPWWMLEHGWARMDFEARPGQICIEIMALLLFNELHFYACHRALHSRPLRRFHRHHHASRVATPFSIYAFHPVEALMLGSVPLLPMLLHAFSPAALCTLPVASILMNTFGHSNYTLQHLSTPVESGHANTRHALHHRHYHGNYGFLLSGLDRLFGTAIAHAPARGQDAA